MQGGETGVSSWCRSDKVLKRSGGAITFIKPSLPRGGSEGLDDAPKQLVSGAASADPLPLSLTLCACPLVLSQSRVLWDQYHLKRTVVNKQAKKVT